jgi:hypothetical protein
MVKINMREKIKNSIKQKNTNKSVRKPEKKGRLDSCRCKRRVTK